MFSLGCWADLGVALVDFVFVAGAVEVVEGVEDLEDLTGAVVEGVGVGVGVGVEIEEEGVDEETEEEEEEGGNDAAASVNVGMSGTDPTGATLSLFLCLFVLIKFQ